MNHLSEKLKILGGYGWWYFVVMLQLAQSLSMAKGYRCRSRFVSLPSNNRWTSSNFGLRIVPVKSRNKPTAGSVAHCLCNLLDVFVWTSECVVFFHGFCPILKVQVDHGNVLFHLIARMDRGRKTSPASGLVVLPNPVFFQENVLYINFEPGIMICLVNFSFFLCFTCWVVFEKWPECWGFEPQNLAEQLDIQVVNWCRGRPVRSTPSRTLVWGVDPECCNLGVLLEAFVFIYMCVCVSIFIYLYLYLYIHFREVVVTDANICFKHIWIGQIAKNEHLKVSPIVHRTGGGYSWDLGWYPTGMVLPWFLAPVSRCFNSATGTLCAII